MRYLIVVVGVGADEVDDLAVAVGGLLIVASRLVDHPEAIPAIMHIGEAFEEVARGALGFVELAGTDEVDGGVGGSVEFVGVVRNISQHGGSRLAQACEMCGSASVALGVLFGGPLTFVRLVHRQATFLVLLATAARAGIIASGFLHRRQRFC
jgi:hypothetical protein